MQQHDVAVEPQVVRRSGVWYAAQRERVHRDRLPEVIPRALGAVSDFLRRHDIVPAGPPLVRYQTIGYDMGEVEIEVGFPVTETELPPHDRVRLGQLPAGRYATVTHRGSYEALVDTTAALLAWGKQTHTNWQVTERGKVTRWGARVEHYNVGPPEPDPHKWRTDIAILLAD